jgi:PAS domain S-box-containing protein
MNIDVRTLIIIMGITNILQVIAVFIQFSINKTYKGIGWWLLGFIWVALGSGLIILREYLAYQTVNIFATNILLLLGPVFHYIGIMRFLNKKENRIFIFSVITILIVLFSIFIKDITVRSAIISSALSVTALFTAWSLFINRMRSISMSTYLMIGLFLLQGGFFAFRAIDLIIAAPVNSTFDPTTLQILAFMVPLIVGILVTFSLIIMVNQRLNVEMTEAKEHYEIIFNTSPDATVITKISDGLILDINEGFSALSGYTRDEAIGTTSLNIWNDPADRQRIVNELKEKGYRENFEAIFRRKDGSTFFGLMSAKIITLRGLPHILSITRDITERKQTETQTLEIEALKRTNQAKSELLANVSHELRTPLASIKGNIETLLATDVEWSMQQQLEFLQSANKEADHLTLLIKDLLDMSHLDSGKLKMDKRTCNVGEILDSASGALSIMTTKHKLKIASLSDLPPLQADKARICQVITNLVENAAKFSAEGSQIVISTRLNAGDVIISVQDHGIGMPPEVVEKLFDRFYQSYQVVAGKTRGTGLGLAICKGVVEAHGGKIWAESQMSKGSKISFSIPVNQI